MVSVDDFQKLERRVVILEGFHFPSPPPTVVEDLPSCVYINQGLYTEKVEEIRNIPIPTHMKTNTRVNHIQINIFLHGDTAKTLNLTKHEQNMYRYLFVRNFFTVVISKFNFNELTSVNPQLNTTNTQNILHYTDGNKHTGLYFGYCNADVDVPSVNMFTSGRNNGIFFIMNDDVFKNRVSKYISGNMGAEIRKLCSVGDGKIDVYVSTRINNLELVLLDSSNHIITSINTPETKFNKFQISVRNSNTPFVISDNNIPEKQLEIYAQVIANENKKSPSWTVDVSKNASVLETRNFKIALISKYNFTYTELDTGVYSLSCGDLTTLYFLYNVTKKPQSKGVPTWKGSKPTVSYGDGIFFLINTPEPPPNLIELRTVVEDKIKVYISNNLKDFYDWKWTL